MIMPKTDSTIDSNWTVEIVPAHAERTDVLVGLVREIFITMIPGTDERDILNALARVKAAGFEPVPHVAARGFRDAHQLSYFFDGLRDHAIEKILVIAGGLNTPSGPYSNSLQMLQSEAFEKSGLSTVALAGHPDGNPVDSKADQSLQKKLSFLREQNKAAEIVTQWSFFPDKVNTYLKQMGTEYPNAPVRIGIPGPASLKTLLKYAKVCGVSASTAVLKKQGLSLARLLLSSDPAKFVNQVEGAPSFHLYPFGGLEKSAEWLQKRN
jgi:methylenetetrahydrofolate reductase (NADPH)